VALVGASVDAVNGLGVAIIAAGRGWARAHLAGHPGIEALVVEADGSLWMAPTLERRARWRV
jgi:thiamine biosynthesis lipoprotein